MTEDGKSITSLSCKAPDVIDVQSPPHIQLDNTDAGGPDEVSAASGCEGPEQGEDEAADSGAAGEPRPASPPHVGGSQKASRKTRAGSKRALIIEMLRQTNGVGVTELATATGWLPHTTRAALTGLRHAGFVLEKSKGEDGKTLYRIVADAATAPQMGGGSNARAA